MALAFLAAVLGLAIKFMWSIVPSAVTPPAVLLYSVVLRGETCGLGTGLADGGRKAAGLINRASSLIVFGFSSSSEASFSGAGLYISFGSDASASSASSEGTMIWPSSKASVAAMLGYPSAAWAPNSFSVALLNAIEDFLET